MPPRSSSHPCKAYVSRATPDKVARILQQNKRTAQGIMATGRGAQPRQGTVSSASRKREYSTVDRTHMLLKPYSDVSQRAALLIWLMALGGRLHPLQTTVGTQTVPGIMQRNDPFWCQDQALQVDLPAQGARRHNPKRATVPLNGLFRHGQSEGSREE